VSLVVSCLCLREGEGAAAGARVRLLLAQRFVSIYTMFFRTGSVRSGLTGLCITKPKTEPNRDFF
jgi:hypothetical protein